MCLSKLVHGSGCQTSTGAKKILASVAALTVAVAALSGCAMFPQSSNPAGDRVITADVETRFGQDAVLEAPNRLDVQTINGIVYLNGFVSAGPQRWDAGSVASQVQGVDKVVNSIAVAR
jgi:BON domain